LFLPVRFVNIKVKDTGKKNHVVDFTCDVNRHQYRKIEGMVSEFLRHYLLSTNVKFIFGISEMLILFKNKKYNAIFELKSHKDK
jgi:hypothetical protein